MLYPNNLTWRSAEEHVRSGKDLIAIPVGSMEGHGYHLPLNTDAIIAEEMSSEVAMKGGFISVPAVTYTVAPLVRTGNVELRFQTFADLMTDIAKSFIKFGFKKVIIILGHGGPDMKKGLIGVASDLLSQGRGLHFGLIHISRVIAEVSSIDTSKDRHAGEWETSLMLHFRPEVVGKKRVKDFSFPSKHGIVGDPTIATREKGAKLASRAVDWIINWINEYSNKEGLYRNW